MIIVAVLLAGLLSGLVLVVVGGGTPTPTTAEGTSGTLPGDLSRESVEAWSGLVLPPSAEEFLTATVGSQLDVTFTMAPEDVDTFVEGSALPAPQPERRVVLHSSPLWKLNPTADPDRDAGEGAETGTPAGESEADDAETAVPSSEIRGVTDVRGTVGRSVELVPEGGLVRARVVLLALA